MVRLLVNTDTMAKSNQSRNCDVLPQYHGVIHMTRSQVGLCCTACQRCFTIVAAFLLQVTRGTFLNRFKCLWSVWPEAHTERSCSWNLLDPDPRTNTFSIDVVSKRITMIVFGVWTSSSFSTPHSFFFPGRFITLHRLSAVTPKTWGCQLIVFVVTRVSPSPVCVY